VRKRRNGRSAQKMPRIIHRDFIESNIGLLFFVAEYTDRLYLGCRTTNLPLHKWDMK
jgi:hypothetical protein|tara:strand:- start:355 stop:525 length:171 start_codon:yes stop_codon:yes gene_type:complete